MPPPCPRSMQSTSRLVILLLGLTVVSKCKSSRPQPVSATTSTDFLGYDGQWSPISVRVGTPEQWLYMLPATLSQETWVIGPGGCDETSTCQQVRGNIFSSDQSSTFQAQGYYELGADASLGNSSSQGDYGLYGFDTVALDDSISASDQIIAVINTTDYLTGQFGLGVQLTRFNESTNDLTFLSSLVQNESLIPSHSYGYTAGASYRLKGVPASLTLGGIDANRFTANDMSFSLSSDYAPVIAINSISVSTGSNALPSNWNTNPMDLLSNTHASTFTIDSSTPFLWLPETVCDDFANALNLTYNDTLQLYVFGEDSSPESLQSWDLAFAFAVSNLPGSTDNIQLALPYDAFNLQLSFPFPLLGGDFGDPSTNYFPLRKAADESEYIIGRAFLQETYLTVDYDRNNFTLSQAVFTEEAVSNVALYAITRNPDSFFPGPKSSSGGLSTGAKAGIGVGVVLSVLAMALILWLFCYRKRRASSEKPSEKPKRRSFLGRLIRPYGSNTTVSELLGDKRHPTEVPADTSNSRFELAGNAPIEMPASEVSPSFFQGREPGESNGTRTQRNDPRRPVEMAHRQSYNKEAEAAAGAAGSDRSASPVPPYSPAKLNQNLSANISPYSARHSQAFGTMSSGEQGISPVGHSSGDGSQRDSNNISSPVSPDATVPRFHQQSAPITHHSSSPTSDSSGAWLSPQVLDRAPSRSPSRSSRFVEEGLSTESDQPNQSNGSHSARFSWE